MEPICWAGILGVVAIGAVIGGFFKGSCHSSKSSGCGSSCDCGSKKESPQTPKGSASTSGIDVQKEKEISDLK